MKFRLFTCLVFILIVSASHAQDTRDSLWGIWIDSTQPALERAKALQEYASEYIPIDADSALVFAQQAYDFSSENKLEYYRSKSKSTMATALKNKGDFEEAEKACLDAIKLAQSLDETSLVAQNFQMLGALYSAKGEYAEAMTYNMQSLDLRTEEGNEQKRADLLNNIGILHIRLGDYDQGASSLEQSYQIYEDLGMPEEQTGPMNNLAILYTRQGDFANAVDLYTKSLAVEERIGNEVSAAYTYFNLSSLYYRQGDNDKFYEYANKSLEIRERLNDKRGMVLCLSGIGSVQYDEKLYDSAKETLTRALSYAEELGLNGNIAQILLVRGAIWVDQKEYGPALEDIERAFQINRVTEDPVKMARSHRVLGYYYKARGHKSKAITELKKGLELAQGLDITITEGIAEMLYELYSEMGRSDLALRNYELYIASRDSIASSENKSEILRQAYKYEYDKKAFTDSLAFASERQIQAAELQQTNNERRALFFVLLVVAGFSILLFNRIRLINKQKTTIEEQNDLLNNLNENLEQKVEERTQEIVAINNTLKESDERYTYALEASNDGIWDYNVPEDWISFSPAIYTMLGFEPYEFPPSREGIYKLLHPEELKTKKRKAHDLFIANGSTDFLLDEYRLKGKDDSTIWVRVKGKVVEKDKAGKPLRIVGTHTDITAEKLKGQELLETVLRTEDAERSRISQEIHDGLQQTLTVSFMNLRTVEQAPGGVDEKVRDTFDLGLKYLQDSITESRSVAHALMPKEIIDYGILPVFESAINDVDKTQENTQYHFSHNLEKGRLSNQQIEITLYRILQEAINNITKYAKANNVYVQLKEYDDIYMLTIEDDGIGFDVETIKKKGTGLGFKSMQNRLDAINGYLEVNSRPGKGTSILVEIDRGEV